MAAFVIGLIFICCTVSCRAAGGQLEVEWECRDRHLWIRAASAQTPRFEAVDEHGVHSISEQLASRCGYTISAFKMDGFTTFRASYYSCFTNNQNDEVFNFRFNVMVSDGAGWTKREVSAVCSGLSWTHREVICEEDYMEVNIDRVSSCDAQRVESGKMQQAAFSQARRTASSAWQLMFLTGDGQVTSMSTSEGQRQGYSLTATSKRVVLRSQYKSPQAELMMVDGLPVEVLQVSLFFKQGLMLVMIDVSMACTVNHGSFDGVRLLLDVPRVLTPLVGEGSVFESRSQSLGAEGVLLDEPTTTARGFSLVKQGGLVQIQVPFGAEGGHRKSLVVNNVYKEMYVISMLYEHVFSLLQEDGSRVDTRFRLLRVLDTPLLCRSPFIDDQTVSGGKVFSIHLGNIPADVILEDVHINGKRLPTAETPERGFAISPLVHVNGSRAYDLRLPFEDAAVRWTYLGEGVMQYSADINFTLTIMPQKDSYYHHAFITARAFDAFPPKITAQCSDGGITFSMVRSAQAESRWEVGVAQEPLTPEMALQRGYRLHNDGQITILQVPVFSIGYTYEDINLSNFYGTFKLVLRDAKGLEVQTSTSKHCLFKTEDMIVCSADGTVTVVTTLGATWPTVQPQITSLLDPSCRPKQTDGSRALFEFKVHSCGTRAMVGDSYVVYENEIRHDRQLIAEGPNFISRESQFKLTVRCFYPLNGVNRLTVDRTFRSETPGFGSFDIFGSLKDSAKRLPGHECSNRVAGNAIKNPSQHGQETPQTPAASLLPHPGIKPQPRTGPSHFITIPGGFNKLSLSTQNLDTLSNLNQSPPNEHQTTGNHQIPLEVPVRPDPLMSHAEEPHDFESPADSAFPNFPPRHDHVPDLSRISFLYSVPQTPAEYSQGHDLAYAKHPHADLFDDTHGQSQHVGSAYSETDRVEPNLEKSAARNIRTMQSGVKNIRVKPPRKFAVTGGPLSRKGITQQAESQSSGHSQYVTGLTAVRSDGDHLMSRPLPEHSGSNTREENLFKGAVPSTLRGEQSVHVVKVKPDHSVRFHLAFPSPNQQEHQNHVKPSPNQQGPQKHLIRSAPSHQRPQQSSGRQAPNQPEILQNLDQYMAQTQHGKGQQTVATRRTSPQTAGVSHVRVRPGLGLSGGLRPPDQTRLQNPGSVTRGGPSGTSDLSSTLQNNPKTPLSTEEYKPAHPYTRRNEGASPAAGRTGFTGSGSDLKTHTSSDCGGVSGQYGVSIHQGIIRGADIFVA